MAEFRSNQASQQQEEDCPPLGIVVSGVPTTEDGADDNNSSNMQSRETSEIVVEGPSSHPQQFLAAHGSSTGGTGRNRGVRHQAHAFQSTGGSGGSATGSGATGSTPVMVMTYSSSGGSGGGGMGRQTSSGENYSRQGTTNMMFSETSGEGGGNNNVISLETEEEVEERERQRLELEAALTGAGSNKSSLIEPYIPTDTIPWTTEKDKLLGEKNMWFYENAEVEEEFNRFFFRDQTSLPITVCYILAMLAPATTRALAGLPSTDLTEYVYLIPGSVCLLLAVILDQYAFLGLTWASSKWRSKIRLGASIFFGYSMLHPAAWYEVWLTAHCWPDAGNYERSCREILDPYLVLPFMALPFMVKVKLHHQVFFLVACYLCTTIAAAVMHELYFSHGAPHIVIFFIFYTMLLVGAVTVGWLRFRSIRRQFEQAVEVVVSYKLAVERQVVINTLLESLVPEAVLPRLMENNEQTLGTVDATEEHLQASILFSDVASFTAWSSSRNAGQVVAMLNPLVTEFDEAAKEAGVERVKTIGDAYWAVCGLPHPNEDHAVILCRFAQEMLRLVEAANQAHPEWKPGSKNGQGIQLRIGVHSGPVTGAILGLKQVAYEVFGQTNDIASLCEQQGEPSYVAVSEAVLQFAPDLEKIGFPQYAGPKSVPNPHFSPTAPEESFASKEKFQLWLLEKKKTFTGDHHGQQLVPGALRGISNDNTNSAAPSRRGSFDSRVSSHSATARSSKYITGLNPAEAKVAEAKRRREAEQRQKKFLEQLRQKRGEMMLQHSPSRSRSFVTDGGFKADDEKLEFEENGEGEEDPWEKEAGKLTVRRFACCCMGFLSREAEEGFETFVIQQTKNLRFVCRLFQSLMSFMMIVFLLIDGRWIGSVGFVLHILSFLISIPSTIICSPKLLQCRYPTADLICVLLSVFFSILGNGIASLSVNDPMVTINVVVNRDVTPFVWGGTLIFAGTYATPVGASPLVLLVTGLLALPTVGIMWVVGLGQLRTDMVVVFFAIITSWVYAVITERVYRTTYFQNQRATFLAQEREENIRSTEDILQKLVPEHVTKGLMRWISAGMAAEESIATNYDNICIGFIQLKERTVISPDFNAFSSSAPSATKISSEPVSDVSATTGDASYSHPSLPAINSGGTPASSSAQIKEAGLWLPTAHREVDDLIDRFSRLTKIKSIGDLVMVAGPFRQSDLEDQSLDDKSEKQASVGSPATAASNARNEVVTNTTRLCEASNELLEFVLEINRALKIPVVAGMHVGPVMTAVLGTNRPTFDVFGDTVNVASRVLTGGRKEEGTVAACSFSFYDLLVKWNRQQHSGGASVPLEDQSSSISNSSETHPNSTPEVEKGLVVPSAAASTVAPSSPPAAAESTTALTTGGAPPAAGRAGAGTNTTAGSSSFVMKINGAKFSEEAVVEAKGKEDLRIRRVLLVGK